MKKNKYDTAIVMLYLLGKENLLPLSFRRKIPYSTVSTWRKEDYSNYFGHEYRFLFDEDCNGLHYQEENRKLKKMLRTSLRAWLHLRSVLKPLVQQARKDQQLQKQLVRAVDYLRQILPLRTVLKLLQLNQALFYEWSATTRHNCPSSFVSLCLKRYPNQLQRNEVEKIKRMLSCSKWQHWPIVSVAGLALRKRNIVASLNTWYKYARLLQITHKAVKKDKKKEGLVATRPNEYLHVDTTYYALRQGQRVFITFVMDNYSKMILGFSVSNRLSFALIKEAIQSALGVMNRHPNALSGQLVADGGRENHNTHIDAFLASLSGCQLTKVRALKDIQFSNSPVEAIHRIMKGRYLRNRSFESLEGLRIFLAKAVEDYNRLRPHCRHLPRTPLEVYFDLPLRFKPRTRMLKASLNRINTNRDTRNCECSRNCGQCKQRK